MRTVAQAPVFSDVDAATLGTLVDNCLTLSYDKGRQIISPGAAADRFFVVLRGQVKIYKSSPRGNEQTLHVYGPGQTFGEAAMWSGGRFPAQAQAIERTVLMVVTRDTLKRNIVRTPELALGMMAGMSAKLREFNLLIEQLSLKEVPQRLAAMLLEQAEAAGSPRITLSQSKREIASRIGAVPETLSRALAKLKARRLIQVKGSQVVILDVQGLRDLVHGGD